MAAAPDERAMAMRMLPIALLGALAMLTATVPAQAGPATDGYPEPSGTTLCALGDTGCVYYCVTTNTYYWYCVSRGCMVGVGAGLTRYGVIRVPLACV